MVVLIGYMGAGKSTVGRLLADLIGVPFVDSDAVIEQREGRAIREIFRTEGETHFRGIERAVIAELLEDRDTVLALGGGAALDPETGRLLASHTVVYLEVPFEQAMARTGHDGSRPMLQAADVREVYERRLPVYESLATIHVDTAGRSADEIAADIAHRLASSPA